MTELKQCPFCGGEARIVDGASVYVTCDKCGGKARQVTFRRVIPFTERRRVRRMCDPAERTKEWNAILAKYEKEIKEDHDRVLALAINYWNTRPDGEEQNDEE